mmetsp:Transcript_42390/g.52165  ORF Transcript_42390/g.52165 Transcript_42390/m.52165 type:complete len:213 (-) Transcript_42390:97-735(-)
MGQNDPQPEGPSCKAAVWFLSGGFGACCSCVGTIFLVLGIVFTVQSAGVDASVDFEKAGTCTITGVVHQARERQETSSSSSGGKTRSTTTLHCWDEYTYRFSLEGSSYTAKVEELKRDFDGFGDTLCSTSVQKPATFSQGATVDCWKRTDTSTELSSVYTCGNPMCYKIFDPADEVEQAQGTGIIFLLIGAGVLVVAALLCTTCWCVGRSMK